LQLVDVINCDFLARIAITTRVEWTMDELLEIINEIREDAGRNPVATIHDQLRLREDLELDSLELAVLTVRIEAAFGVDVFERGMINTVGEILRKLPTKT
jgi:acyl carrier protein